MPPARGFYHDRCEAANDNGSASVVICILRPNLTFVLLCSIMFHIRVRRILPAIYRKEEHDDHGAQVGP
jgi:hypothetical protein